jgi:hypothetical protein
VDRARKKTYKLLRRQVANGRAGKHGKLETAVYENTYVFDPAGNIVLLNPDNANKVFLTTERQVPDQ